jgi:hypothetical protein
LSSRSSGEKGKHLQLKELQPYTADEIESEKGIKLICIMGYNG